MGRIRRTRVSHLCTALFDNGTLFHSASRDHRHGSSAVARANQTCSTSRRCDTLRVQRTSCARPPNARGVLRVRIESKLFREPDCAQHRSVADRLDDAFLHVYRCVPVFLAIYPPVCVKAAAWHTTRLKETIDVCKFRQPLSSQLNTNIQTRQRPRQAHTPNTATRPIPVPEWPPKFQAVLD